MTGPVLYVVPIGPGQPDDDAQAVIRAFAAAGFGIVMHAGGIDEATIGDQAVSARAAAILLCPDARANLAPFRPLVRRVRASNADPGSIFDVLVVSLPDDDVLEGDRGAPFTIHPSESEKSMRWVAEFVARSAGFR